MAGISQQRTKIDPVAIASKGQITSKIQNQESSDKGIVTANDDVPRITSSRD